MGAKLTREQLARRMEAARLYRDEGLSLTETSTLLGVSHKTVWRWCKALGVEMRPWGAHRPGLPCCERCEILLQDAEEGHCADCVWELAHPGRIRMLPSEMELMAEALEAAP